MNRFIVVGAALALLLVGPAVVQAGSICLRHSELPGGTGRTYPFRPHHHRWNDWGARPQQHSVLDLHCRRQHHALRGRVLRIHARRR